MRIAARMTDAWRRLLEDWSAIQWRDIVPARRPSAGAVPGRWGACLAVRTHRPLFFHESVC